MTMDALKAILLPSGKNTLRGKPDPPSLQRDACSLDSLNGILSQLQHLDQSSNLTIGKMKASGGFVDVYEGSLRVKGRKDKQRVAVKRFRVFADDDKDFVKVR